MATVGGMASIFQLAFTLNAATGLVYGSFDRTLNALTEFAAKEFQARDASLVLTERKKVELRKFMLRAQKGIWFINRTLFIAEALLLIGLGISFIGLLKSAMTPDAEISATAVVLLSIFLLVIGPGVAVVYATVLKWLEGRAILSMSEKPQEMDVMAKSFAIIEDNRPAMEEMKRVLQHAREVEAWLYFHRLRRRFDRFWEKIAAVLR